MNEQEVAGRQRRVLPAKVVDQLTGLTRAQRWNEEKAGRFPQRVQITPFRVGYFSDEVDNWIATRPRGGADVVTPRSPGRLGRRKTNDAPEAA
jgi:predicted DNA-binding transcriptional regulator AlpA